MPGTIRDYDRVRSIEELKALVRQLESSDRPIGFDIETGYRGQFVDKRSLDPQQAFIVGFSLSDDPSRARYVPIDHGAEFPDNDNLPPSEVWPIMRKLLTEHKLVIHNLRFEVAFLSRIAEKDGGPINIPVDNVTDTMLLSYVAGKRRWHGLKFLTEEVLQENQVALVDLFLRPDPLTGKIPRRRRDIRFNLLEPNDPAVISYACDDAALCLELLPALESEIAAGQKWMRKLEHKVVDVVVDMEYRGLTVDWTSLHRARAEGEQFVAALEVELRQHMSDAVGRDCSTLNFNSNPQMQRFVYGTPEEGGLGLTATRFTDKKAPSTDALSLHQFEEQVPVFAEFRKFKEAENTLRKLAGWVEDFSSAPDGKIHPSYMQTVVASGRFSANNPNIQQVQKDWLFSTVAGDRMWAGNFRGLITPAPGHYFLTYDVSQIELRMLAGLSREPYLLRAFAKGLDVHTATAAAMLGKPEEEVTKKERAQGKCLTGDTLVRTPQGLVRLDSLCAERRPEYLVPLLGSGIEVWDGTKFQDVVGFYSDGDRPVWQIRTSRGYEVTATADHPWWTPSGWVKTGELVAENSWIAMSLGGAPTGDPISVPFSPSGPTSESSPTLTVTEDWAAVAALADYSQWNGDSKNLPGGTTLYNIPKPTGDIAAKLRHHFSRVGVKPREVDTLANGRDLAFASSWFGSAVEAMRSEGDIVSSAILASPSAVQATYLRTMFDIGARFDRKEIRILLPDEPARQVQILLAGLGVRSELNWAARSVVKGLYAGLEDDDPSGWSYLLIDDLRDLTRYRAVVGTSSRRHRSKLNSWGDDLSTPAYGDWDLVTEVLYVGRRPVFDLTVDVSSRFEANGLIGSNTLNFALLYGMQIKSLSERMLVTLDEAKDLYRLYFSSFPGIKSWVDRMHRQGQSKGYVETLFGRRVPIFEYDSGDRFIRSKGDRLVVNSPVQGSAADSLKIVMVNVKKVLQERGWWGTKVFLVMNLHDALTFEVSEDVDPAELRELLTPIVEMHSARSGKLHDFPHIEVEWEIGYNWGVSTPWPSDASVVFDDGRWKVVKEVRRDVSDVDPDGGHHDNDGPRAADRPAETTTAPRTEPVEDVQQPLHRSSGGGSPSMDADSSVGLPRPGISPEGQTSQMRVAVLEPPPPPQAPMMGTAVVELVFPDRLTKAEAECLKQLLDANPGPQRCVLVTGENRKELPIGTSLTEADRYSLQSRIPGAILRRVGIDDSFGDDLSWS